MNRIRAIMQTSDGYLWLGTQKGMIRFDGHDFDVLELPPNPEWRNRVPAVLRNTSDGNLWFGMESGGLGSWNNRTGFIRPEWKPWNSGNLSVLALIEASNGAIWLGTGRGTAFWFPQSTNITYVTADLWNTRALLEDAQKRIWIGTEDRGLYVWDKGKLERFSTPALTNCSILCLATDAQSNLWVGTQLGLRCFDRQLRPVTLTPVTSEVCALHTDRGGAVWIGTSGEGLGRYYQGQFETLQHTNGLANDFVSALTEDHEGSLWIATREGLSQLSDVKFPIIGPNDGIRGGACHSVSAGRKAGVWIASTAGLSWFNGPGTVRNFTPAIDGLSSAYIKRVREARNGDVYLINGTRAIEVLAGDKVVARHSFENWPTALAEDSRGMIASVGAELYRIHRGELSPIPFPGENKPPFYWIRNLFTCADDSILISTVNGLFRMRHDVIEKHWPLASSDPTESDVSFACEDDEKTIWLGQKFGLSRLKNDHAFRFTDELTDTAVYSIVPDHRGTLWIATTRGFIRLNRKSANEVADGGNARLAGTLFDGLDAVKTIDTAEVEFVACRSTDGKIWFPTPQGPVRIDPDKVPINAMRPPVAIQTVRANGKSFRPGVAAKIQPGRGELAFQFTALSLLAPQKVQFRYKLEGYDPDWVEAGVRRSALYANLKPRSYTFRVQACNSDGLWNETGASVTVILPPHYYQTAWFQFLIASLCAASLGGIYVWRTTHLRHKQQRLQSANELLESKILERTRELCDQRNLLRTLIDHLPDDVFVKDAQGRVIINNLAHSRTMGVDDPQLAIGKTDFDCYPLAQAEEFRNAEQKLLSTGIEYNAEEYVMLKNGTPRWQRTTKVPLRDSHGEIIGLAGIHRDITERKKWEAQLEALHKQLLESSRQAGMAEVATSVLHNVGNVLNSVNVSASIVAEQTRDSGLHRLERVVTLLQENRANLPQFLGTDRGDKLVHYLETLHGAMTKDRARVQEEIQSLTNNVEHIKKIVAMQQSYARVSGLIEMVKPTELLEEALRLHETAYQRHHIRVLRDFHPVPTVLTDRHKVIQILVNLLQNAKYACDVNEPADRLVTLRITPVAENRIQFVVKDNGMGISSENLTRIFSYGFTTRKNGHGFGLHSGALAAKEMGGSLTVHSDGPGQGAVFTLELPVEHKSKGSGHSNTARITKAQTAPA